MTDCSFPGCRTTPDPELVQVKATRTDELNHLPLRPKPDEDQPEIPPGVALARLCPDHRAEFERLGWLAPADEDDDPTNDHP